MKLEHANLSVTDIDATTRFITTALPQTRVRGEGRDNAGRLWRHVGTTDCYVALQAVPANERREPYGNTAGLNHLGWEVDDVEALVKRMHHAGLEPNLRIDTSPARRRVYFFDPDGNDWEFVEYLTDDLAARHSYAD